MHRTHEGREVPVALSLVRLSRGFVRVGVPVFVAVVLLMLVLVVVVVRVLVRVRMRVRMAVRGVGVEMGVSAVILRPVDVQAT